MNNDPTVTLRWTETTEYETKVPLSELIKVINQGQAHRYDTTAEDMLTDPSSLTGQPGDALDAFLAARDDKGVLECTDRSITEASVSD